MIGAAPQRPALWLRLWQYQAERFPLLQHGMLIAAFTFSAAAYSRMCRGVGGFVGWTDFGFGVFVTLSLFALVRLFDEFKDHADDVRFRSYLPVPRGLVSLRELGYVAGGLITLQVLAVALWQPSLFPLYALALGYLLLMRVEFFVPEWLKARHLLYIASHMVIIPLIDLYASGLDWRLAGAAPHAGLIWFFAVSFANGIVLEFGRKLRVPATEEAGVLSYTKYFGPRGGVVAWLIVLLITLSLAVGAAQYAGYGILAAGWLVGFFLLCAAPGLLFLRAPSARLTRYIEYASGLWTIGMYLSLGALPLLKNFWL